jgi:hypothetical protein
MRGIYYENKNFSFGISPPPLNGKFQFKSTELVEVGEKN